MSETLGTPYDAEHLSDLKASKNKKRVYKKRAELTADQVEARRMSDKKWRETHRELASARASASQKKRYENDPEFQAFKKATAELAYLEKTISQ